jgi:2',3'-cyclic-nucleotide 2'-phosphodiesterase (5'-nucleotidase family)
MSMLKKAMTAITALTLLAAAGASSSPGTEAHLPSQAAADVLRDFAGADGAFLAAGLVKDVPARDNLAALLQFPSDEVVVVKLTGATIRQAFDRSLAFHPQENSSFLQVSGFEITFSRRGDATSRILSITANGSRLDESREYTVAMPSSLGRGGQGYFKLWDKSKIVKTFEGQTVEDVLKGKRFFETSPRWVAQP